MAGEKVPGEHRLFSLVLALVASPQGATKRELLSSVYGYSDRYRPGEVSPTLERQFERDKEQLRTLGIPIETLDSPLEPGNTQLIRYRISKQQLQIPAELRFSERELMLLKMAALAWSEGSLTDQSRRAAMKLEAMGAGVDLQHLGLAPQISVSEPAAPHLQRALDELREVTFDYLLPGRMAPLKRRVAPLHLHRADGRWHLIAFDLERDATRVFLLSRIVSEVTLTRATFAAELKAQAPAVVDELLERERQQPGEVRVRCGTVAESRLTPRAFSAPSADSDGWVTLTVGTLDYREHALADELVGYGPDVEVVHPTSLRTAVIERLQSIRDQHRAGALGGPDA